MCRLPTASLLLFGKGAYRESCGQIAQDSGDEVERRFKLAPVAPTSSHAAISEESVSNPATAATLILALAGASAESVLAFYFSTCSRPAARRKSA
jgi:hypothetical protein